MSSGDTRCQPVTEDQDNTENFTPEENLGVSPLRRFCAKGDVRKESVAERLVLTSLQINTDCGSENIKSSNPVELSSESKEFTPNSVLHNKQDSSSIPVKSENQSLSSASEDHSSATAQSTSEGTWKSCVDTPSPFQSAPVVSSDKYDTAEDTSNCSFEDLPSSKEVSFTLPPGYSEWVQTAASYNQPSVPPTTNSVQTLSHIVTTVLENNPEICPQSLDELAVDAPEGNRDTVNSQSSCPSAASHILHRSGVLQENKETPNLSDSFSDLICQFSNLNVADQSLSASVSDFHEPVVTDSNFVEPAGVFSVPSNNLESARTPSEVSATDCDSISETELLPFADAHEDPFSKAASSTLVASKPEEKQFPVDAPIDVGEDNLLNCSSVVGDHLPEEKFLPVAGSVEVDVSSENSCDYSNVVVVDSLPQENKQLPIDSSLDVKEDTSVNYSEYSSVVGDHLPEGNNQLTVDKDTLVNCSVVGKDKQLPVDEPVAVKDDISLNCPEYSSDQLPVDTPVASSPVNCTENVLVVGSCLPEEQNNCETDSLSVKAEGDLKVTGVADDRRLEKQLQVDELVPEPEVDGHLIDSSSDTRDSVAVENSSHVAEQPELVDSSLLVSSEAVEQVLVTELSDAGKDLETLCADFESLDVAEKQQTRDSDSSSSCQIEDSSPQLDAPTNEVVSALNTEVETKQADFKNIPCVENAVDTNALHETNDVVTPAEFENESSPLDDNFAVCDVDRECSPEALNTTDALFSEFNLHASDNLTPAAPLKSLLDSTFTDDGSLTTNNQNFVASVPSVETQLACPNHSEKVVLEVPADTVLKVLEENQHEPCKLSNNVLPVDNTSTEPVAKEVEFKEEFEKPKESDTQVDKSVNSFTDLPAVDTSDLERLIQEHHGVNCTLDAMPMHMMEAHLDHQWHQNDQVNSLVSDNNCDVDVNVNQCHPMQGNNYLHNDANLKSLTQVNSDNTGDSSVTSSPNKRKNDEDSAFEDLATVEDANSDLVDDHIMDDQVEEIGVAAVNRRSPSQTRVPEHSPKNRAGSNLDGSGKVSDLPALNHSEAGPVVAEFTEEELRAAAEVFKDPSTFEFLERVSNSKAFEESSLSRLSLYVKFDPLVSNKSQENQSRSTFKKPVAPQKKSVPVGQEASSRDEELISTTTDFSSSPIHRRELDAQKLIDFQSPNPPQVARANPKMVPVEPVQRIENMQPCKVFTEDDMKKAMKINELMFNERVIKKEKELAEAESKLKAQAEAAKEQNSVLQESLAFTRRLLDESGQMVRQWQEKKELERVEVTRERDQALEDLRSVEASFSELHRRYEKIKAVLEGYKQNEEGLRVQLLDTQDKLRSQEQMYDALKEHTQEKLESANLEIENAKKAGGSEIAVLRSQLMKAEMKVNSLEKSLEHKAQEYLQLTAIYDDLIARVSGGQ